MSLNSSSRAKALTKIVKRLPTEMVYYGSALGAIVLASGGSLPAGLEFVAGGIGANQLSTLIDDIAQGEDLLDEEIRERAADAINKSDIANLLTDHSFLQEYARLIHRVDAQSTLGQEILDELRKSFRASATAEQVDELKQILLGLVAQSSNISNTRTRLFISYARADDEPFVEQLYNDLKDEFQVWWDRTSMPNRGLTFLQEIRDAIDNADRLLLVVGPAAFVSDYVRDEWQYAYETYKGINIALRSGDYSDLPEQLRTFDALDFRNDIDYAERTKTLKRQLTEPVAPLGALLNVPALPPHFLPRQDDLDELRSLVIEDVDKPTLISAEKRTTAVEGMGGIGKSVLAASFAYDRKVRFAFPDGIVWITTGREAKMYDLYRSLGVALGDDLSNYPDEMTARHSSQKMLAQKKTLIILDDVWELHVARSFRDLISGTPARLLVTTRNLQINDVLDANEYRLKLISASQAIDYLRSWVGDDPDLGTVAGKLGYLFLALKLAGARMKKDGLKGVDYLTRFQSVSDVKIGRKPTDREESLDISIRLGIEAVFDAEQDSLLYHTFGIFQEDVFIPENTILRLWQYIRSDIPYSELREILTELVDLALVERNTEDNAVSLHDLLHSYTREKIANRYVQTHQDLLDSYMVSRWPELPVGDRYIWRSLSYHLIEAEKRYQLIGLLTTSPEWLEKSFVATAGFAGVMNDLNNAFQTSKILSEDNVSDVLRLAAVQEVVRERIGAYQDIDLKTLTCLGRIDEAVTHARLRKDIYGRAVGLLAIYEAYGESAGSLLVKNPNSILEEVVGLLERIQEPLQRDTIQAYIVQVLCHKGLLSDAEDILRGIQSDYYRDIAIEDIALQNCLIGNFSNAGAYLDQISVERKMLNSSRRVYQAFVNEGNLEYAINHLIDVDNDVIEDKFAYPDFQIDIILEILSRSNDNRIIVDDILKYLLEMVKYISGNISDMPTIAYLAERLSDLGYLSEALQCLEVLSGSYWYRMPLPSIVSQLVYQNRISEAEALIDLRQKEDAIYKLVSSLIVTNRSSEAEYIAEKYGIDLEAQQIRKLVVLDYAREGLIDKAKRYFDPDFDEESRIRIAFAIALNAPDWLLHIARDIDDDSVLLDIALHLVNGKLHDFSIAILATLQLQKTDETKLIRIVRDLSEAGYHREVSSVIDQIGDSRLQALLLRHVANILALTNAEFAYRVLERVVREIEIPADNLLRAAALHFSAREYAKRGNLHASDLAIRIENVAWRSLTLNVISRELINSGKLKEAFEIATLIDQKQYRFSAMEMLVVSLANTGDIATAREALDHINDRTVYNKAAATLSVALARIGDTGAIDLANTIDNSRLDPLDELFEVFLQRNDFEAAKLVIDQVHDPNSIYALREKLALRMAETNQLDKAIEIVREIGDPAIRSQVMIVVATIIARYDVQFALTVINDESIAAVCNGLAAHGDVDSAIKLLQSVKEFGHRIEIQYDVVRGLAKAGYADKAFRVVLELFPVEVHAKAFTTAAVILAENNHLNEAWGFLDHLPNMEERDTVYYSLSTAAARTGNISDILATVPLMSTAHQRSKAYVDAFKVFCTQYPLNNLITAISAVYDTSRRTEISLSLATAIEYVPTTLGASPLLNAQGTYQTFYFETPDPTIQAGVSAYKRGDRKEARRLFEQAVERDAYNEAAWLWLSTVVEDLEERRICLENVLVINPNNLRARLGLENPVSKVDPSIPTNLDPLLDIWFKHNLWTPAIRLAQLLNSDELIEKIAKQLIDMSLWADAFFLLSKLPAVTQSTLLPSIRKHLSDTGQGIIARRLPLAGNGSDNRLNRSRRSRFDSRLDLMQIVRERIPEYQLPEWHHLFNTSDNRGATASEYDVWSEGLLGTLPFEMPPSSTNFTGQSDSDGVSSTDERRWLETLKPIELRKEAWDGNIASLAYTGDTTTVVPEESDATSTFPKSLDDLLVHIGKWAESLNELQPNLAGKIMDDCIQIAGWSSPFWREINISVEKQEG